MNKRLLWSIGAFIIIYFFISLIAGYYADYKWFANNKGTSIFWILYSTKFIVHTIFSVIFILLFFSNFLLIRIMGGKGRIFTKSILDKLNFQVLGSTRKVIFFFMFGGLLFMAFIMGSVASQYWKEYLMFINGSPFDTKIFPVDPLFGKNIAFYVFSLPFYSFLYNWMTASLVIIAGFSIVFHFLNGGIFRGDGKIEFSLFARAHLSTVLAMLVILLGAGYRISSYELLFSNMGKFYGAGYTDVNTRLFAFYTAMAISGAAAALLLFNIFRRSFKLALSVLVILFPAYFLLNTIIPSFQQRFFVEPNELELENPFIKSNILFTRIAYNIDKVKEFDFANEQKLTYDSLKKNREALESVRLWDWQPLRQTYKQIQGFKPYYYFHDVDVDRYMIDDKKVAVNLAARELDTAQLNENSKSWQNLHLIFTHGYGVVASRVDQITEEGMPRMIISDIPSVSSVNIPVDYPQIYYGEHDNPYIITNTGIGEGEFDYPSGNKNKFTTYTGTGGIDLSGPFNKFFFSTAFKDINILISGNITEKSRIHYRRNIIEMVNTFTPFLEFDEDPYIVVSGGKVYWIIDGYTMTDKFPYSTPYSGKNVKFNYIRNSVKVIIDAYNGTMDYYIVDKDDPIIAAYGKIFKNIFKDFSAMPDDLKAHVRYPETLFNIQSEMLLTYHMTDPNVFYNKEDMWEVPQQKLENQQVQVESYYLVTRLPGETASSFMLMLPFSPQKKDNMLAFLVAKCDMPDYGDLKLYRFPKGRLSYGPNQIESRIDQDPEISKQLTLWGQKGSSVIRGNIITLPIEDSIIYIEPLYLQADTGRMPELKRVIVAYGNTIVMEKDLETSLERLFSKSSLTQASDDSASIDIQIKELAGKAYTHYIQAERFMREGDWAQYGEALKNLKSILEHMKNIR